MLILTKKRQIICLSKAQCAERILNEIANICKSFIDRMKEHDLEVPNIVSIKCYIEEGHRIKELDGAANSDSSQIWQIGCAT